MPVTQDYISELERRHGNTPELQELKRRYIPESNIGIDDLDSEHQEKIRDTLFYSTISDSDPNDVYDYIEEIKEQEKGSRYEDFIKSVSKGIASVGSAFSNLAANQGNYYIPSSGGMAPILPKQEEKIQKITQEGQRELAKSADFLWRITNDPSLAMTHNDLFAKASDMIGQTLPYIAATTAGGLIAGPAGAFAVGASVEGNNAYRTALDEGVDEKKAQIIGVGVGIVSGAIESFGFKKVEKLFERSAERLKDKAIRRALTEFTGATIVEALEEGAQEVAAITGESTYKKVDWNEAVTRTLGAMAGGAFLGGAVKGGGIAFQQSMLMANKKPAKIPEEYLVKEPTVSQPTESVTQTEPTTTNVTQATTPAVEPQTIAEGEVGTKQPKNIKNPFEESVVQNPVFHGTTKQFDTFGGSEHGLYYFTEKEDYAKKYAHDKGLVKKAFLNIKNPLEISDFDLSENYTTLSNFVEELEYASNNKTFAESVKNEWEATYGEEDEFYRWEIVATQEFRDLLIKYGYDGIRASEGFTNIWVTVSPEQIIENKSSFTPPVEVQPEKVKTERIPQEIFPEIQGEGETKVRGLAKSISDMMDNEDLRLAAADETYQVSSQKKRLNENAAVLVVNEPDRAKRIALAQEAPNTKDGVFPEDVYTALRNKARIEGDVDTQIQLMKSPIAKSATEMGRRIQALDTGEERDPVRAGQDLIAAKEKAFEKKTGKKVKEAVKKEAKKIKKKGKETMLSKQDWHDFIASLQC